MRDVEAKPKKSSVTFQSIYKKAKGAPHTYNTNSEVIFDCYNPQFRQIMDQMNDNKVALPLVKRVDIRNWKNTGPDLDKFLWQCIPDGLPMLCLNWYYQDMIYGDRIINGLSKALSKVTKKIHLNYMKIFPHEFIDILVSSRNAQWLIFRYCNIRSAPGMNFGR